MTTPIRYDLSEYTATSGLVTLVFSGAADMSASLTTQWVPRPSWASRAYIAYTWTNTGTPVGTFNVSLSDTGVGTGQTYSPAPANNPVGTGSGNHAIIVTDIAAPFVSFTYTRTSGGTGAVVTATITWGA